MVVLAVSALAVVPWASAAFTSTLAKGRTVAAAAAFPNFPQAVAADTPKFYYRFEDSSGTTVADAGPNGQPGVYAAGVATVAQTYQQSGTNSPITGESNPGVWCNGTTSYLVSDGPAVAGPNTFSVEAWFKVANGYAAGGKIIGFGADNDDPSWSYDRQIHLRTDGRVAFGVNVNGAITAVTSAAAYNNGSWHHVVGTLTAGGTLRLYIDGVSVGTPVAGVPGGEPYNGYWRVCADRTDFWAGSGTPTGTGTYYLAGWVDEVAVYHSELNSTKVSAHYSARTGAYGAVVAADGPNLHWRLAEAGPVRAFANSSGAGPAALNFLGPIHQQQAGALGGGQAATSSAWFNGQAAVAYNPTPYTNPGFATGESGCTVHAWFKTDTQRGGAIVGFGNAANGGASPNRDRLLYMSDNGRIGWGIYNGALRTILSSAAYNDNTWHLAHGTVGPAGLRLYIDGALVGSDTSVTSAQAIANGYWHIGYENVSGWPSAPTNSHFAGYLDEIAVYHSQLSDAQIAVHYYARDRVA